MHFLGQHWKLDTQLLWSCLRKFAQAALYGPSLNWVNYSLIAAKESFIYCILLSFHFTNQMLPLDLYNILDKISLPDLIPHQENGIQILCVTPSSTNLTFK
jgi:hypothetical protein